MKIADLERWREIMGLSKTAAAELLGIGRQHYSEIVADRQPIPHWMPLACAAHYHRIGPWPEVWLRGRQP